jgi:glycosyltransferase involved in cell wall biosynthesis
MRVAIATDWFAPRRGGIESQLVALAGALGSRGHQVEVLTSTPGATTGAGYSARVVPVATVPVLDLALSPAVFAAMRRELSRGYDVVHAHVSVVSPIGYAAAVAARSLGLPTVVTFHSVLRGKRFLLRAARLLTGIDGAAVVWSGVSALVAAQLRSALGARTDVRVLPNGTDLATWRAVARVQPAGAGKDVVLVSTMRLHRKKRPGQLLQAFASAMRGQAVQAKLMIFGDGPEMARLQGMARQLEDTVGESGVELRGWLPPSALRACYASADAFALASVRESFGIATLEARAAGLPVIAMRAAGSSEFLRDNESALLCEDDRELAAAIRRLLTDPVLRQRLRQEVPPLDAYDWATVVARHETAYADATMRSDAAAAAAAR